MNNKDEMKRLLESVSVKEAEMFRPGTTIFSHPFLIKVDKMFVDEPDAILMYDEGNLVVTIDADIEMYEDRMEEYETTNLSNFQAGQDYQWNIAGGDDGAHAITIANPAMIDDKGVQSFIYDVAGPGTY